MSGIFGAHHRLLAAPLQLLGDLDEAWVPPRSAAITQARQRLGPEVLRWLYEHTAVPVSTPSSRGARCLDRLAVSLDGMEFEAFDNDANRAVFGGHGETGLPKVRVVTMVEDGSRATLAAVISPVGGKGSGERSAAHDLVGRLRADMCLFCDAGFFGFDLWCKADATGAALIWRVGDTLVLDTVAVLPDGSYLSLVFAPRVTPAIRRRLLGAARAGEDLSEDTDRVRLVRVVEYYIDADRDKPLIALLTNHLDPDTAPAAEIAAGYHERWEHEESNKQIKEVMLAGRRTLRSKSPDMVRQEIYAYLLVHHALCAMICHTATVTDLDPDRIRFIRAIRLARRRLSSPAAFSP